MTLFDKVAHLCLCIGEKNSNYPNDLIQLVTDWYAEIVQPSIMLFYDNKKQYTIIGFYLIFKDRYVTHEPAQDISWPEQLKIVSLNLPGDKIKGLNNPFNYHLISSKTGTNITSTGYNLSNLTLDLNPYHVQYVYNQSVQRDNIIRDNPIEFTILDNVDNMIKYRSNLDNSIKNYNLIATLINYTYIKSTIKGLEYLVNGYTYK